MTTKRRPLRHTARPRISPQAVELFCRLEAIPKSVRQTGEPYALYREYLDGVKTLCRLCGLWWGDAGNPVDVDSATPPDYMLACNPYQADRWREAWRWRCALEAAAIESASSGTSGRSHF